MSCDPSKTIESHPAQPQSAYTAPQVPTNSASYRADRRNRASVILGLQGSKCKSTPAYLVNTLIEAITKPTDTSYDEITAISHVIPTIDAKKELTDLLRAASRHSDPWVRSEAVRAMGAMKDEGMIRSIAVMMDDPSNQVRLSVCESLSNFGEKALPGLSSILQQKQAPERVKTSAIRIVMQMVANGLDLTKTEVREPVVKAFLGAMDDNLPGVRAAAMAGISVVASDSAKLKKLPERFTAKIMFASTSDPDPSVRMLADKIIFLDQGLSRY